MSIRGRAAIVGFHEIPTLSQYGERSTHGLLAEVAHGAIRDSGLRIEDIDGLITRTYTLDRINEAYEELERGVVGRGIISFE